MDALAVFQSPVQSRDEDGQIVQGWTDEFDEWANVRYLRGGETVMQARMLSRSPAIVTIYASDLALRVTSEWRVVIDGRMFEIKEDPRPTPDRAFLEMLAEAQ